MSKKSFETIKEIGSIVLGILFFVFLFAMIVKCDDGKISILDILRL